MANGNAKTQQPRRRSWRKDIQHRLGGLFCCSCLSGEETDPLQDQDMANKAAPQHPHLDEQGPGEKEIIQIIVEDVGMVNTGFSLLDEEPPRSSKARSASSVSACPQALKKRRLKPLSSLPQDLPLITGSTGDGDEDKEEDMLLRKSGSADSTAASGSLLSQPVIHLIPPTPSDVADDGQFFDVNSEEGVGRISSRDGGCAAGDGESCKQGERVEAEELPEELTLAEISDDGAGELDEAPNELDEVPNDHFGEEGEVSPTKMGEEERKKPRFSRSPHQVASLPEHPRKNSLSDREVRCSNTLKADLCRPPHATSMDSFTHHRRLISRSYSAGETLTRSATFHALSPTCDHRREERSAQQRRTTIASYMPRSEEQNGNFSVKDVDRQEAKSLGKLNTDEVCQWFTGIGLAKCLPFIREAKLHGADIASVDMDLLDTLQITTLDEREHLLSAIYNKLHPPTTVTQRLDSLLESAGTSDIKTFTATLASMSKSRSSPHVSCLSMSRRSLKLRDTGQNYTAQRNSQLIEITINASERIVHLRTPKETSVAKVMESCIKMLGTTDDRSLFTLKETAGSPEDLLPEQQIGTLLKSSPENTQLELHLCKTDKHSSPAPPNKLESNSSDENIYKSVQVSPTAKGERIKELKQQVDSLQNVILQIQELHHDLVAFCSELKSMDGDTNADALGCKELEQRLELLKIRLNDKKESLRALRDNANDSRDHRKKQLDVRLLEKMKLNCQVFKEEISIVHLNRQVAHFKSVLQDSYDKEKAQRKSLAIGSLSQLVSQQSPVMLLAVQENHNADGHYGFTCRHREGGGLVVETVDNSHLCVGDRLVEVNSVPVLNSTVEEVTELLLQGAGAQIVVLRHPPPAVASQQHPLLPLTPSTMQNIGLERAAVTMETPPQRKVIAI